MQMKPPMMLRPKLSETAADASERSSWVTVCGLTAAESVASDFESVASLVLAAESPVDATAELAVLDADDWVAEPAALTAALLEAAAVFCVAVPAGCGLPVAVLQSFLLWHRTDW